MSNEDKTEKEPKLALRETWNEVMRKQRGLMMAMVALLVLSVIFLIFCLFVIRPQNSVVIVGYGDVYGEIAGLSGGYRRDNWLNMLAFPLLAVIFGVVHNVLALRIYRKYGKSMAMVFVVGTMLLLIGIIVTLLRVTGEW